MNITRPLQLLLPVILLCLAPLQAQDHSTAPSSVHVPLEYKVISDFKQPFNDKLKEEISKGWTPVGGVSVTVWNSDLYFAQLLSRPASKAAVDQAN